MPIGGKIQPGAQRLPPPTTKLSTANPNTRLGLLKSGGLTLLLSKKSLTARIAQKVSGGASDWFQSRQSGMHLPPSWGMGSQCHLVQRSPPHVSKPGRSEHCCGILGSQARAMRERHTPTASSQEGAAHASLLSGHRVPLMPPHSAPHP